MNKYEELKSIINSYCEKDCVEDTADVISLYTLKSILQNKFSELENARNLDSIKNKVVALEKAKERKSLFNFGHKRAKSPICNNVNLSLFEEKGVYCSIISFYYDDCYSTIGIDFGDDHFYFGGYGNNISEDIIDACADEIYTAFRVGDEFIDLFSKEPEILKINRYSPHILQQVKIDGFDINFSYELYDNVKSIIKFDDSIDPLGVQYREWVGDRKMLSSIVLENHDEILKRVPIAVGDLNPICKSVYQDYHKSHQKKRV